MPLTLCDVLSLLLRSLRAMGCFFGCFRVGDNRRHQHQRLPVCDPSLSVGRNQDAVVPRNQLSSLFQAQVKEDAVLNGNVNLAHRSARPSTKSSEFKAEAKFLEKDKLPQCYTPSVKTSQLWATAPTSVDSPTPSSCVINEQSKTHLSSSSQEDTVDTASTVNLQDGTPHKSKYVRFEDESENSPRTCLPAELLKTGDRSVPSPYPTPLNFSADMQTPGTVFASGNNNNAHVRSQYVYTVSDPNDYSLANTQGDLSEHPKSITETSINETSAYPEGDLSSWFKPPKHDVDRKPRLGKSQEDRPIIGLVATHWREEEEVPRVSPKEWDGNGIPNSTTKYKEDQKVSWHATPFEERLEKALSEESVISERKPVDTEPVLFQVEEDNDTAATTLQLQSFSHQKSVVSC